MATRSAIHWLLVGSCACSALASGMAQAQTAGEVAPEAPPAGREEIVVTGSRIARPDYVSNSPIVSVGSEAIQNSGQITIERSLTQMPQFSGSFGQSNGGSTSTGLNGGQSYASLRGLGPKRTLLLLDGRRLQPSNPDGSVDLNIIPEALIENVEVITGGASTTYGSDATAGVVNFRLKRKFDGVELNSQYGVSDYGDGQSFRITGTVGGEFADGKGSAVLSVDYTDRGRAYQKKRPYYLARSNVPGTATLPQGTALFGGNTPTLASVNALFQGKYGTAALPGSAAGRYTAQLGFNTDGSLFSTVNVPVLNFRDPESDLAYIVTSSPGSQQINFGFTGSSIQSNLKRYNIFGKTEYELSDHLKVFAQVTYTSYSSVGLSNPTLASNVYGLSVPVTNPFIPADFRPILASRADPNADFSFYKAFNLLGPRYQGYEYNVYQITTGASGDIGVKDWTWDLYGSVSQAKFENWQTGGASFQALHDLLYSPNGGTSLCAGGFNPFGDRTPSQACVDYISRRTLNTNELRQRTVEGNIQGELFKGWAGPVRFAVGADYRYNSYGFQPDSAFSLPNGTSDIVGYSVLLAARGKVSTKEIYGELLFPVAKDLPLVQELNLDLGARYSDYSSVGGVATYKADLDWRVFEPLRLRGGYNRAIRTPSVGELYAPVSTGSVGIGAPNRSNNSGDPCDTRSSYRQGANSAKVQAICLAQGMPASLVGTYALGTSQVFALTGGNPELEEETADTFSAGAVITSPFSSPLFRRMSLSVDWYKIKVKGAIGPLSISQAFQFCFNADGSNPTYDPNNYYCGLVGRRNPSTGVPVNPSQPLLNLGKFDVSGVDVQFDWQVDLDDLGLGNAGKLSLNTAVSYLDKFASQALPGAPTYDYAGTIGFSIDTAGGIAHPRWKSITALSWSKGPATLGFRWRFIDKMKSNQSVTSATSTLRGINAYNVFDLNARLDLPWNGELRLAITNLFNKTPPQNGDEAGNFDSQNYDTIGRYFSFGISQRF
ncbi:TonB-dependent receptor domain-containing protein [Sphingomonas quercus]|uniref:TonB-dependent receptor n=1 Tax=Sphingomonas quercus TaxID=2842451 RepID=A0ABS6BD71_9SPHN|nr:TonB-dependent receptor [Sphingomonas quercus]MBU3076262.1 TonB-dependent receptor [Sphingomonas quercus]